jgi:hypothetical protein
VLPNWDYAYVVPFGYFNGCKLVFLCDCFFSAQKLVDQEQWNKTKNARCTGGGGEDSLDHEAYPDKPHVGCVNPRPGTGSPYGTNFPLLSIPDLFKDKKS